MAYGEANDRVTDGDTWPPRGQTLDPNMLRAKKTARDTI